MREQEDGPKGGRAAFPFWTPRGDEEVRRGPEEKKGTRVWKREGTLVTT